MDARKTICVVDDNIDLVKMVTTMLEAKNFNTIGAYSGLELFSKLEGQKPDLIVLDIMMPEMDGFEVLERLKSNPDTSSIPVILVTALIEESDMHRGHEAGADCYITKPFKINQLIQTINLLLHGGTS